MTYIDKINTLKFISFDQIRLLASQDLNSYSQIERDNFWRQLNRGTALLDSHELLCQYLHSFGKMHKAKILNALKHLPEDAFENGLEIIDWGCGQALGTINLFDFLNEKKLLKNVRKVTLIEPAVLALERAEFHVKAYVEDCVVVDARAQFFDTLTAEDITANPRNTVIHIFSNILDVREIDLKHLSNLLDESIVSENYFICVGPLNPTNHRIDAFFSYFDENLLTNIYHCEERNFEGRSWTYKGKVAKLLPLDYGHLIPINYYPPVSFKAAFEVDIIRKYRLENTKHYQLKFFEVAAPFDLGASVYDDVHPILAVLHNLIVRGTPTKASLLIERTFAESFGHTIEIEKDGQIEFVANGFKLNQDIDRLFLGETINVDFEQGDSFDQLQLVMVPIAIARFQKVLIEAIITGHLSLDKDKWRMLVEEKDVPFARLAVDDFKEAFNNLSALSKEFDDLILPEIDLLIVNESKYNESPLSSNVLKSITDKLKSIEFDIVVTQTCLDSSIDIDEFSAFKAKNNCYFNIKPTNDQVAERVIYTTDTIIYKDLIERDNQGQYHEVQSSRDHLIYFLNQLFRKTDFRPGQLPILDRALKGQAVIGLLPTGGGKSLTYQLAALLQPGVTMVIDPLKSLMEDQFEGLLNNGIDCAGYINSSLSSTQRKGRENELESSQLLFVFLSPERLSIAAFRERLKHMHDYNVYFSYGVIDEVHCVSEWGHDFRFSYLHLGRNLYNYVKAKNHEISLFGLTATASFDVLADVERELSGNGAFELDADVIVRYENTNRLELQYRIESVSVDFSEDQYYDPHKQLDSDLPKAINIGDQWTPFGTKANSLGSIVKKIPSLIDELLEPRNKESIITQYVERQASDEGALADLNVLMPFDYYSEKTDYDSAGIVFCPHTKRTPLSVEKNKKNLNDLGVRNVASFTGKDGDDQANINIKKFRKNKSPLMVATKAFGMGIDKPNVRFTVNMNYSSSLEAFVQEAGRSGRDRKMALATILVSDYHLSQIRRTYQSSEFPIQILRGKWFKKTDLEQILNRYQIHIPEEEILHATPENDIVQLHCSKDNKMFAYRKCSDECSFYLGCQLKKAPQEARGWKAESELLAILKDHSLSLAKKHFRYLNADYEAVMYFFNNSFKGDLVEKQFMNRLLSKESVYINGSTQSGFLTAVLSAELNEEIVVYIPYTEEEYADLAKAIYRMNCIELIEDFTQNYSNKQFRILTRRKEIGEYHLGLKRFLLRYYTNDRSDLELEKARQAQVNEEDVEPIVKEIYQCLSYLTQFVYDKVSEKRKRAIDDMRNFCMEGTSDEYTWIENNERLKDFIFYYFNSKYAKSDYVADNGEPFSLVEDTDSGRVSNTETLFKYLRVIDDDIVGFGTPLDNVKHLYGAIRLISRSLTDSNPTIYLLEVFCLAYMGTRNNANLDRQLKERYFEGLTDFYNRMNGEGFWELFERFNAKIQIYLEPEIFRNLSLQASVEVHSNQLEQITELYIEHGRSSN